MTDYVPPLAELHSGIAPLQQAWPCPSCTCSAASAAAGSWQMGRVAIAATSAATAQAGQGKYGDDYLKELLELADFHARHVAVHAQAFAATVIGGE